MINNRENFPFNVQNNSNVNLENLSIKTYKDRLIYLIFEDIYYHSNDLTSLLLYGFKGFRFMSLDDLEESVIDRYQVEEKDLPKLLTNLIKRRKM